MIPGILHVNVYFLSSSIKIDSRVKLARLVVHRMLFKHGFVCMCVCFISVLTAWTSVRDPSLLEAGVYSRPDVHQRPAFISRSFMVDCVLE